MAEENINQVLEDAAETVEAEVSEATEAVEEEAAEAAETVEGSTDNAKKKSPVDEPYQVFPYKEPESFEYAGSYFVYGMAIGLMIGIVLFFLFGQNKILLSVATIGGAIVGACLKKKGGPKN